MLPDNDIWRDTVLAIVEKDNPGNRSVSVKSSIEEPKGIYIHSIWIHRFAGVEVEVTEIRYDLFSIVFLDPLLERLDLSLIRAVLLELLDDLLEVA